MALTRPPATHDRLWALKQRIGAIARTSGGRKASRALSLLFTFCILLYLSIQLSDIGWMEVWAEAPQTPWFYVIFIAMYFTLPVCESFIYQLLWRFPKRQSLPTLIKKRVYSRYLVDYSGEAYLFFWARRRSQCSDRHLLAMLKDNIILSSAVSLGFVGLVIVVLLIFGMIRLPARLGATNDLYVAGVAAVMAGICMGIYHFRGRLLQLSGSLLYGVAALHGGRLLLIHTLQVLQWIVVHPDMSMCSWLTLLVAQMVLYRIPLIPNREFVFVSVGLGMAELVEFEQAALAGLLFVVGLLEKGTHLFCFGIVSFIERQGVRDTAGRLKTRARMN